MATAKAPTTTMVIRDVQLTDGGDMVISVLATRGGREYALPYQIAKRNITTVDIEYLKLKVIEDVDSREAEASKEAATLKALRHWQGKTINLE